MKATLEFTLPEESGEHMEAVRAREAWTVLAEIDSYLRGKLKHGLCTGANGEWPHVAETVRGMIAEARIPE